MSAPGAGDRDTPDCPSNKTGSYLTFDLARKALQSIKRRHRSNVPRPRNAYRCPDCRMWHLTSQEREATEAHKRREARTRHRRQS